MNAEEKESLQSKKRAILGDGDQNKSTATILSLWERKKASNDQQQPAPVECTQNDSAEHPDATIELAATEAVEAESPALRRSSRRRTTIISISDDDDDDIVESKPSPQKRKVPRLFETKADRKARADKKKREIEADELFLAEKRAKEEARKKAQDEERAELARKRQRQLKEMQTSAFGGGGNGTGFFSKRSKPIVTIDLVNCTEEPVIQRKPLSKRIWTMPLFPTASMISRQSLSDVVTPNSNVSPSQKEIPVSSSSANAEQTAASRENLSMNLVHYSLHNEKDSPLQHALDRLRNLPRRTNHNKLWIDQHSRQFAGSARVALDSISEWLTSRWGSALEAASSESGQKFIEYDEYFDSDDEGVESASLGASLIVGPVGTGKTAVAKAAAHFCGFEVLELDTSESCSASELKSLFVEATQSHRLTSRTLLLIDIDAPALNADKSFARALRKLVLSAKCPVVATATCDTAADLAYAVGCARHHILSRVSKDELSDFLIEVVGRRNLSGGDDADWQLVGGHIAARTKGDTRRAINELQLLLATDCIQVDEDYPVEEDSPSYVQGVAVATPDDDHISPRAVPTVPEGFPAVNSIEVEGAPRVIGISPRQLSASSDTTLTITARLDDEILLSVYVGETACSEVTATRADGDTYFTVTAVVPRPTHLDTAYAQVLLVSFPPRLRLEQDNRTQITRDGRRSDFAIADRYADIVSSILPLEQYSLITFYRLLSNSLETCSNVVVDCAGI